MVLSIADIPAILVIAGLIFIFISIVREINGQIRTSVSAYGAKILAALGVINLITGIVTGAFGIFSFYEPKPTPILTPSPPTLITPISSLTPTPTPLSTPTPIPTPPLTINITDPPDKTKVSRFITVKGKISGEIPKDQYMWVVVHPRVAMGWWPQLGQIKSFGGMWNTQAAIGQDKDVGMEFDIAVILVNKDSNQYYQNYIEQSTKTSNYLEIPLREDAITYDSIMVTRR